VRFWSSSCCSCDKNKKITFTILIKRQNQLKFGKILHVLLRGEDQLVISLVKKKQSHSMISKPNRLPFKLLEKPNWPYYLVIVCFWFWFSLYIRCLWNISFWKKRVSKYKRHRMALTICLQWTASWITKMSRDSIPNYIQKISWQRRI
jgi:hypothetical protein